MKDDYFEEILLLRIDQIRIKNIAEQKRYYEEQESILKILTEEEREKFEEISCKIALMEVSEFKEVYIKGFLDGLNLGHKAFN